MTKTILCFSRSYLATFLPHLVSQGDAVSALYIVQSNAEQQKIEAGGGRVVLNLEQMGAEALERPKAERREWREPADMRTLTGFDWSPVYADRYLPEFSEDDRSALAGAIQQKLDQIFSEHVIDGVLSEPVALFPTHYMLYLCKKTGAVPLYWANTYFPGFFFFVSGINLSNPVRKGRLDDARHSELIVAAGNYVNRVAEDKAGPVYHHKFSSGKKGMGSYVRQRRGEEALVLGTGIQTLSLQLARLARVFWKRARFPKKSDYMTAGAVFEHRFYMKNLMGGRRHYDATPKEFSANNVFFPLQYEPEASLLYSAPDFRDQASMIESALQCLPEGHLLWVKEHPNQFGALSHGRWPEMRRRYSNLRLVFGRENGRHLIQRCGLALAITSTAGMDALIYGRKCIVMGEVFFRDFPGALPLRSIDGLSAALNDPSNYCTEVAPEFDRTLLTDALVTFFGRHSYQGDPQPSSELYDPQNVEALYHAILNEIGVESAA